MFALLLVLLIFVVWKVLIGNRRLNKLPPGPGGRLPLLGNLWQLHPERPFETVDDWSRTYGDVFSMQFGSDHVIVLSRDRILREAFVKEGDNFSARPSLFVHESCWGRGHVISDGPHNAEMRRFLMGALRQRTIFLENRSFNSGTKGGEGSLQWLLAREVHRMKTRLDQQLTSGDDTIDIGDTVLFVVGNVLTEIVMGRNFEHGSQEFRQNSRWLEETTWLMEKSAPLTFLPFLRFLPGGFGYYEMKKQAEIVNRMMQKDIEQRRKSGEYRDESREDITSVFLRKIDEVRESGWRCEEKEKKENFDKSDLHHPPTHPIYSEEMLARVMTELFFAGIQTEVFTFCWAFLYLIHYPQVQQRLRAEIVEKVGPEGEIAWERRSQLPYLEAVVHEVQRCANIAPFAMFHRNQVETWLDGYRIPAHSTILMNLYSTMRDPDCFPEPEVFRPERFLTAEGKVDRRKGLYPYGLGRRICMGEDIARSELFAVIGSLVQRYSFEALDPLHPPSLQPKMQLTLNPQKYKLRFKKVDY